MRALLIQSALLLAAVVPRKIRKMSSRYRPPPGAQTPKASVAPRITRPPTVAFNFVVWALLLPENSGLNKKTFKNSASRRSYISSARLAALFGFKFAIDTIFLNYSIPSQRQDVAKVPLVSSIR